MNVINKEQKQGLYIIEKTFKENPLLKKGEYCYVEFDRPKIYFYLCDSKDFKLILPVCLDWQYSETEEAKKELQNYFNNLKRVED